LVSWSPRIDIGNWPGLTREARKIFRDPEQVQNIIHEAIHERTGRSGEASPVVTQLDRLEAMLMRGSITKAEFNVQKRKLLG